MARIKVELVKYHTQQVKFTGDEITRLVLQFLCETASRFENTVLYSVRRDYFEKNQEFYIAPGRDDQPRMYRKSKAITGVSYPKLWKQFKDRPDYSVLGGQQASGSTQVRQARKILGCRVRPGYHQAQQPNARCHQQDCPVPSQSLPEK